MINGNQSIEEMFQDVKERIDQAYKHLESSLNYPIPIRHLNWL